ncbi:MAG: hypothetical protein M3Y27_28130 [Acidobacteriota bacterium]|nr:hypothetical protein [Acidobacteriota bacterium]
MQDNENTPQIWISGVSYNAAGQTTQMNGPSGVLETRSYNPLSQVTQITAPGMSMSYNYSPTQNDGQITQAVDGVSGEAVSYQYDALKRLINASSTGATTWSEGYQYDGFGNLTGKTPGGSIQPAAPYMSILATRRQTGRRAQERRRTTRTAT